MVSVADLLQEDRIAGNYFGYENYISGDLELGLLENRRGDRLIAVPDTLIAALYEGLEQETGEASRLVLFNCGKWWGKNFYTRFSEEVTDYYNKSLSEMDMATFLQSLKECWATHGWGKLEFDPEYQGQGLLLIKTFNSPYSKAMSNPNLPSCYLEAGILTSFFSRLTGRDLLAVQTSCESMGADCNRFIVGLSERLNRVEAMVEEGLDHAAIIEDLIA
jgi:uncharacterized protein